MDHNNFADEEFNAGAICPDDMMPISAEEYEPTYRNVPLDCQPQEAEYRGVSMMKGPTQVFDFFPQDHYIEPEDDRYIVTQQNKKMPENFAGVDIKLEMDDISCIDYSFSPICVPQPPIVVLSTSFKCTKSVDDIIAAVNNVFGAIGVSFEFTPALSEYNAVYVKGKLICSSRWRFGTPTCLFLIYLFFFSLMFFPSLRCYLHEIPSAHL